MDKKIEESILYYAKRCGRYNIYNNLLDSTLYITYNEIIEKLIIDMFIKKINIDNNNEEEMIHYSNIYNVIQEGRSGCCG